MRILIVGSQAEATLTELTEYGAFSDSDVLEIHTPPEGTPKYDMVVGDNCVRVYPNTIQFLKPFIKKAEEAAKAKPVDGEAVPKPKKKAAPKKKSAPTIEIVLPEDPSIEGVQYDPVASSNVIENLFTAPMEPHLKSYLKPFIPMPDPNVEST
jgi:hypothetical protein